MRYGVYATYTLSILISSEKCWFLIAASVKLSWGWKQLATHNLRRALCPTSREALIGFYRCPKWDAFSYSANLTQYLVYASSIHFSSHDFVEKMYSYVCRSPKLEKFVDFYCFAYIVYLKIDGTIDLVSWEILSLEVLGPVKIRLALDLFRMIESILVPPWKTLRQWTPHANSKTSDLSAQTSRLALAFAGRTLLKQISCKTTHIIAFVFK